MEKVVVVFDFLNPETGVIMRMTKLWNEDAPAADYINSYMDSRPDLKWKYNEGDELKGLSPGAVIEFYGYTDDEHCDDMITVFHTESEDPDADPYKRIIRTLIYGYETSDDIPEDEQDHLAYAIDMFRGLLTKIEELEQKNREKIEEAYENE